MEQKRIEISLLDLNRVIKRSIKSVVPRGIWVKGEIASLNTNRSGHCYIELIQKRVDGTIEARGRATIWSSRLENINNKFLRYTGKRLSAGIKVMFNVDVDFHEQYGLNLSILDVDPAFTLGDLAKDKQEVIAKLKKGGLFDINRAVPVSYPILNIAIVSAESAAGYGDFIEHIKSSGFNFNVKLFPAFMQGDQAKKSIVDAFRAIELDHKLFDIAILCRGGGSVIDLSIFDSYEIAESISKMSIPVYTGIGHERDISVADEVANRKFKTPTAVADHLISLVVESYNTLSLFQDKIDKRSRQILIDNREQLTSLSKLLYPLTMDRMKSERLRISKIESSIYLSSKVFLKRSDSYLEIKGSSLDKIVNNTVKDNIYKLDAISQRLENSVGKVLALATSQLSNLESRSKLLDPINILKRGFSIVYKDGEVISSSEGLVEGDLLEIQLADGLVKSKVDK